MDLNSGTAEGSLLAPSQWGASAKRAFSPMRLLHVIHGLSPADGGPPENLRQLAAGYAQVGIEAEVLSQDSPDAPYLGDYPFRGRQSPSMDAMPFSMTGWPLT